MAFPTRSCASSAMVSRRSDRLDVSNPPSRLSMRAIRGPRLVRPGLVARTRGDARRPENGIIRPFHRSPRPPSLAGCGSQAHPYARSASEPTLPEAETARCGSARTPRWARPPGPRSRCARDHLPRAPFVILPNESILFGAGRSPALTLSGSPSRRAPGQARPSPRPKASARRRRIGDPSHVRDSRFRPAPARPGGRLSLRCAAARRSYRPPPRSARPSHLPRPPVEPIPSLWNREAPPWTRARPTWT